MQYDVEIVLETSEAAALLWSHCIKYRFPNHQYRELYDIKKHVCNDVIFRLDHACSSICNDCDVCSNIILNKMRNRYRN